MNFKDKKIMFVVAHPDDETLGAGATINNLIQNYNSTVHVVILGEGITSRSSKRDEVIWKSELKNHKKNIKAAQKILGYQTLSTYNFPDNRFDSIALLDIIKIIEEEKINFNPDYIFTHHGGDLNIDHQKTFESVITAFRPLKEENLKSIITFETPSSTEWIPSTVNKQFVPNFYIEVTKENLELKIKAMESYKYEKRLFPHPRSPKSLKVLAEYRGINVGKKYAEAFCLVRAIY